MALLITGPLIIMLPLLFRVPPLIIRVIPFSIVSESLGCIAREIPVTVQVLVVEFQVEMLEERDRHEVWFFKSIIVDAFTFCIDDEIKTTEAANTMPIRSLFNYQPAIQF